MGCTAVEACCDASEVLELVEAALDGVTDLVGLEVVRDQRLPGRIARDDRFGAHVRDEVTQGIGIVSLVGEHAARREAFEQGRGERCIAALSGCEDQLQRSAEGIHGHVDFGRQSSSGTPQSLIPLFGRHPCRWLPAGGRARGSSRD